MCEASFTREQTAEREKIDLSTGNAIKGRIGRERHGACSGSMANPPVHGGSLMSRSNVMNLIGALAASAFVLAGAGCTRDNASAAAPVGGGGPADPSTRTPCSSNADCGGGMICTTIGCCPGCHSDADCASDSQCVAGSPNFCAPKTASNPPPGVVGQPAPNPIAHPTNQNPTCLADADCLKGNVCVVGKCTATCTATSCGAGNSCVNGRCYAPGGGVTGCGLTAIIVCNSDAQCGNGRACSGGQCKGVCTGAAQCGIGQECINGLCGDPGRPAIAACVYDNDCGTAFRCLNAACHPLCATDAQCPTNNVCDNGVCRASIRPAG
jgi:hypothetical protein